MMNNMERACVQTAVARFPRFSDMMNETERAWWFRTFWELRERVREVSPQDDKGGTT